MADLTPTERLQPSLLDRLRDDQPEKDSESRHDRVIDLKRLRASVIRDLENLLNCCNLASITNLDDYPQTASSVLNYGVPDLAGVTAASVNVDGMERMMQECIRRFEPRILPKSLRIKATSNPDAMGQNSLRFEISGQMWAQPVAQEFFAKTDVDLELGLVSVVGGN